MRAYFFGNMYLRSIHQGIQAAHVTSELFNKYGGSKSSKRNALSEWAEDHKTMILLNAGYGENIHALSDRFRSTENPYPWANFYEAKESLDGAITCVGIVLPEKIYESAAFLRSLPYKKRAEEMEHTATTGVLHRTTNDGTIITEFLSKWEFKFVQELNNYGMAS